MGTGLSLLGLDDTEENPLYLSKEEAMSTEVLPRSKGFEPAPRTALSVPAFSASPVPAAESKMSLASILDAKLAAPTPQTTADVGQPQEKKQSLASVLDSKFGMTTPTTEVALVEPAKESGDTGRGFTTALEQTPALLYGALGFAGATAEKTFGTGGASSALKNFGLSEYGRRMKEIGAKAKDTDDVTKAWDKAKQGDLGALVDWAQYGVGYLGGNIVETVATSALGAFAGGVAAGPAAPAGAVAGATAGAVGKEAVKGVAKNLIEGMVAKEAARIAEKAGVETATEQMLKEATKNVAKNIGSTTALAGSGIIKETGGIYGEAEEQARAEGRELTGGDLARIFGSGVVAGLSEAAVDRLGLDVAAGKINIPGAGRPGRALIGGAAGVGIEGGQELFQTAIERFGAGKTLTGEDAMNEYINAFALGGLGGGTVGAVVGAFRDGKTSPDRVRQILDQARADMTSDDGRQELFDAMFDDEKIGPILQANGIESGDDPRFQDVIVKALATQRMLVDLEAPTPEVRAETRKQREADILAAFGETASTAVGGSTGATEPVIQRASVTPNLETRTLEGTPQPVILPETTGGQAGTVALSPEDLVARQEGFEPLVGITTDKGPVGNRFPSLQAAETFLFGPVDKKTNQRSGGYAQTNLLGQGLEARIRQGKRSKAEGGGTFFFVETRKRPEVSVATPAAPVVTPAVTPVTPAVTPVAPVATTKTEKTKKGKAAKAPAAVAPAVTAPVVEAVAPAQPQRAEFTAVAKTNFDTAIDQAGEYASLDEALGAYRQNTIDTLTDNGETDQVVLQQAGDAFDRLVSDYKSKQGETDATQKRQVTKGGQPKREGTGKQVPAVGEDRGVKAEEQTGGGEAGRGDQPIEGGTQPQEVKPAVDPAMQARVKERINKAFEGSGLDLEDVVALNKMVDDGDLVGAVSSMKKIVEDNLGAGAGAKFSMSKEQPTTTGRDFSYAKLKTVDDLNNEVRAYLKRQGSTATFTAKRVPLGDIVGKVPGISAVQRVAALFGKKPIYFAVEEGSVNDFDGAVLSGSDTIFININSSRPHIRIFGHELVHSLRASNNATYQRLVNSLTPLLDQAGMFDYRLVMSKEGVKDPALILEEAIGDIVGDRFGESAFWQMLADDNPTMFQQVARIVMDFIDNVIAKLRGDQSLGSKNLITDLNAVRRAVADVLGNIQPAAAQEAVAQPTGIPAFSQKRMDLPAEPGTQPIPNGYVRLYHQTDTESLDKIAKEGLSIKYARGIEGPRAIYAGETPFYGPVETRPTLEFIVPKEQWDAPFVLQDVQPNQIIAAHYPWHRRVRYLEDEGNASILQKALAGEFDDLEGDYKLAVQYVKDKYGKATEEVAPTMFSQAKGGQIFYSALERAFADPKISLDKNGATTGQQWKAWLESNRAKIGVKKEEIEYVGINDWLDLNEKEKLTPDQVRTWVGANKVGINDVLLTSDRPDGAPVADIREPTDEDMREFINDWIAENQFEDNIGSVDESIFETGPDDMTGLEMRQWITDNYGWQNFLYKHRRLMERFQRGRVTNMLKPKHGDDWLVLPGGKNYAELVLFDPTVGKYKEDDDVHFGDVTQGRSIGWLRMNQRKDKDGNDVLFIEEIQSQRAQEGRKKGFVKKDDKALADRAANLEDEADSLTDDLENLRIEVINMRDDRDAYEEMDDDVFESTVSGFEKQIQEKEARLAAIENEINMLPSVGEVPIAPFVEKTESWTALLLKRAMAYAQQVGIDRVAWTTGEQQNERYQFKGDELAYVKDKNTNTYALIIKRKGTNYRGTTGIPEKDLPDYVGDAMAKRIVEDKGGKTSKKYNRVSNSFTGDDLKLMTANLRPYYNQTLPSVAKEVMKNLKADGKVEVFDIESTGQQLGFVIPESVQEQVANDGFPMFSRRRYEEQFSDVDDKTKDAAIRKGYYSPPTIKERLDHLKPRLWDRVIQGTFDKFRAVKGISNKAYMMLRMSAGSQDGAVSALLHYGQVFDDDGALNVKKGSKGLLEALDPVGGEVDRFLLWIAANRAANLSKDERERFFSQEDIRVLQKLNMGTMKNGKSRIGVYAEALKNMNELNRSVLDVARTTGLIDAEAYKRFSADIWYVPFYRQMEDDGSLSAAQTSSGAVGQYLSKKLKGSDRPLNDLMENVLMNWSHILSASMKNKAAVETLRAATDMGDIVTKLPAQVKGAVKVMEGGKETYYMIEDEFLMNSLVAVAQAPSYGFWMDTARGFKTTLTRFISLSPTFKINNLIRDSIQSIGLSELSRSPIGNVLQGWRAYKNERAEALAGGGLFAMGNAFDGDQSASVKRLLKTGVDKASILDTQEKAMAFFRSAQDKYDEVSDASENANRLALYQQLRAKGASHLEAAYAARDLQDFSLQGSWTAIRYASQVLPYFNARLQGMYKLGRDGLDPTMQVLTGKASDTERQKAAKFATVTGAVVATAFILYLSQKDDEDWKKREDWDRDAFFWFKIPGTDKAVRIPKPFEMGAIATIFERALEQMVDSSVEGKVFGKRLLHVLTDNFAINPIPQAIRPLYDVARNKDGFTDRPIESMGMERISVENRVSPGTSAAAVAIGTVNSMFAEFASKATGGAINSQSVQLSAIQYDYMIKGYLGWVGTGIQTASNAMATPFKDGSSSRYERIDDFLVVGNYVKTVPQAQSRYVTSFYENAKDIATASADVSHFLNAGQFDKARDIYQEKSDKLALAKLYTKGTNMLSSISDQIKMVEDDKTMSGAEKRLEIERLQQVRIQIAKSVEDVRIGSKKKFADGGLVKFDPESEDYDYDTAVAAGLGPDGKDENAGHWGSVTKASAEDRKKYGLPDESYVVLKGRKHETWDKAEEAERERGSEIVKKGDRYYSIPKK